MIGNMHWILNERERLKVRLLIRCSLFLKVRDLGSFLA